MNDHFWPSLYPGILVGGLVGLTRGGVVAVIVGAIGGTAGAGLMYFLTAFLHWEDSAVSLVLLIAGSVAGGYAATGGLARLASKPRDTESSR